MADQLLSDNDLAKSSNNNTTSRLLINIFADSPKNISKLIDTSLPISLTYETWALCIVGSLLGTLTLWTIFGNGLVLLSLARFPRLRTTPNLLIGNLAMSDSLLALTVMPLSGTTDLTGYWSFGQVTCNIWLSIDVLYCTASIWGLVAIAFDRFTATVFPVWYRDANRDQRRVVTYIVLVWVLSMLTCLPPLIGWDGNRLENPRERFRKSYVFDNVTKRHQCILFNEPNYVIYSAMGSFIIPLVVMIILYTKIFAVLQERARLLRRKQKVTVKASAAYQVSQQAQKPATNGLITKSAQSDDTPIQLHPISNPCAPQNSSQLDIQVHQSDSKDCVPRMNEKIPLTQYMASTGDLTSPWELQKKPSDRPKQSDTKSIDIRPNGQSDKNNKLITNTLGEMYHSSISDKPNNCWKWCIKSRPHDNTSSDKLLISSKNGGAKTKKSNKKVKVNDQPTNHQAKVDRREQRATKRMALIIALFVLCWIPFTMMYMIRSLCGEEKCPDYIHLRMFVTWLGYANSGLNPILYTIFNEEFREAFGTLLCGKKWARQQGKRSHL